MCFDCNMAYVIKGRIFHLWYRVGTQKVSDFGAFWISSFLIRNADPT